MASSISQRTVKLNNIQRLIAEYANEPEEKLVQFCLNNRHSVAAIANALSVTPFALRRKYPHLMHKEAQDAEL